MKWISIKNDSTFFNFILNDKIFKKSSKFFINSKCSKIDSILFNINNIESWLYNVSFDTLKIMNKDSLFDLNIDEDKVFKYDFR